MNEIERNNIAAAAAAAAALAVEGGVVYKVADPVALVVNNLVVKNVVVNHLVE